MDSKRLDNLQWMRPVVTSPASAVAPRSFGTLVVSSGLSNLADGIVKVALPLLAAASTRSPAAVAALEFVRSAPWLVTSLHVGVFVDRVDRRRTMVAANIVRALAVAVPAVALVGGHVSLWLLFVAALGAGVSEVFYDTAAQTVVPAVVPRERLDRANGRLYAVELGAQELVGPVVAGVLVATALTLSLAAPVALWVAAVIALSTMPGRFRVARVGPRAPVRADLREGLAFLLGHDVLRTMALMVGAVNLATSAVFAVLVLYAVGPESEMGLSEPGFGLLFAVFATGGLAGSLLVGRVNRVLGRARTFPVSVLGMAGLPATLALSADVRVVGAAAFVSGVAMMLWNVTTVSFRQRITPDHLLGRVNSAYRLVAWGTRPLGAALGGAIGHVAGLRGVFVVMAVVTAAALVPNRRLTERNLAVAEARSLRSTT